MKSEMKVGFVGYTTKAKKDWKEYAPAVAAPSNYKDESKKAAYVKEALEKQEINAGSTPLQSEFHEFCLIEQGYEQGRMIEPGVRLESLVKFTHIGVIGGTMMRHLLICESILYSRRVFPEFWWLFRSIRTGYQFLADKDFQVEVFDPVHALTCTSALDENLDVVLKAYNSTVEGYDARTRALFTEKLCALMGVGVAGCG